MTGLLRPVSANFAITQGVFGHNSNEPPGRILSASSGKHIAPKKAYVAPEYAHLHLACDIGCPVGTPVIAGATGIIVQQGINARFSDGSIDGEWYQFLQIRRDATSQTLLFDTHLSKFIAKVGQRVLRGQRKALSGNTGRSSGPHDHTEVIVAPRWMSPWQAFFSGTHYDPRQCWEGGALAGRLFLVSNV